MRKRLEQDSNRLPVERDSLATSTPSDVQCVHGSRHARLGGPHKESVTDDLALVGRFPRGRGEDAFRALYRAHTPALYALASRLTAGDRAMTGRSPICWTPR